MRQSRIRQPAKSYEKHLKDGYYIEVSDKGSQYAMKIWKEDLKSMQDAAKYYATHKKVVELGEYRNGHAISENLSS